MSDMTYDYEIGFDVARYCKAVLYGFQYNVNLDDLVFRKALLKSLDFSEQYDFLTDTEKERIYSLLDKPCSCSLSNVVSGGGCGSGGCSI